jgi:hypothetical protein
MPGQVHDIPNDHIDLLTVPAIAATDATANVAVWHVPFNSYLRSVKVVYAATLTGANTNSVDVEVLDNNNTTSLGKIQYRAGTNAAVGVETEVLDSAANDLPADDDDQKSLGKAYDRDQNIFIKRTLVGAGGLALPASTWIITYRSRGRDDRWKRDGSDN